MHLSEWKQQWAWNEMNEKYQWAWKLSSVCNITVVLICMSYLLFFFSDPPMKVCLGISLLIKTLTLTLWRFIFIGPAHRCRRAPRSSLASLRLCLSPVISSCHRKACSFPQSFLNCFQEWIIVPSELPTGGFHEVSSLWVDFKSIYFPLLPFPPLTLCSIIETFQECQCMQMLSLSQRTLAKNTDEKQVS